SERGLKNFRGGKNFSQGESLRARLESFRGGKNFSQGESLRARLESFRGGKNFVRDIKYFEVKNYGLLRADGH
ncbi:MAG: hypothetical protein IJG80_10875, partial [Selenomonadaceae bacterium]|nr:hypothetical protein [Selenomonadaceae bacterium]